MRLQVRRVVTGHADDGVVAHLKAGDVLVPRARS